MPRFSLCIARIAKRLSSRCSAVFQLFYPRETFCGILRYVEREDFTFENARKAAGNVAGLCDWVKAMCTYHNIAKVVAPKTDALRKAEQSLLVANKKLSLAMDDLTECQRELDVMQAKFDAAKAEKQRLQVVQSEAIT
jgi:dynein heavy chain